MKKYIQFFAVFFITLAVIGLAWNNPAWASGQPSDAASSLFEIEVGETGSYTVGGLCQFNAVYTGSGASAKVTVDIPDSSEVPEVEGQIYLGGCRIAHSVLGEVMDKMSPAYGSWEICFGDRPGEQLTIYSAGVPLITTARDGMVCAPANDTGVYLIGRQFTNTYAETGGNGNGPQPSNRGTVKPPSPVDTGIITQSGTYNIGGIATITILFQKPGFSSVVKVEDNIKLSSSVPFPDNEGLLSLPGVHVFYYNAGQLVTDVAADEVDAKICFAAIPNKETTIYVYSASDDTAGSITSDWLPLETTIENGLACAPANQTGVYAPAGK